jgi:hypothetical protein
MKTATLACLLLALVVVANAQQRASCGRGRSGFGYSGGEIKVCALIRVEKSPVTIRCWHEPKIILVLIALAEF